MKLSVEVIASWFERRKDYGNGLSGPDDLFPIETEAFEFFNGLILVADDQADLRIGLDPDLGGDESMILDDDPDLVRCVGGTDQ